MYGAITPIVLLVRKPLTLVYRIVVVLVLTIYNVCNIVMSVLLLTNVVRLVVLIVRPMEIVFGMHWVVSNVKIIPVKNPPDVMHLVLPILIV
jgi:hypothetical protein